MAAVLPVCTLGVPYINGEWDTFCQETGLRVVMDAAAAICDQKISTYHHTCFSLHATKFLVLERAVSSFNLLMESRKIFGH